jgi:hypothetical protein
MDVQIVSKQITDAKHIIIDVIEALKKKHPPMSRS